MQLTARFVPVPRVACAPGRSLLSSLAIGFAILTIGLASPRPLPFGPAANGSIVVRDADRRHRTPSTRWPELPRPLIAGATKDETPDFSPDGSQFVFARGTPDGDRWRRSWSPTADGSNVRPLTGPILTGLERLVARQHARGRRRQAPAVDTLTDRTASTGRAPLGSPVDGTWRDRV